MVHVDSNIKLTQTRTTYSSVLQVYIGIERNTKSIIFYDSLWYMYNIPGSIQCRNVIYMYIQSIIYSPTPSSSGCIIPWHKIGLHYNTESFSQQAPVTT